MTAELITRRTAVKYASLIAAAASGLSLHAGYAATLSARGYGTHPNLQKRVVPWPKTLSNLQLSILACLCDIVLPADLPHPSASTVGVHEFLDEWVSAPYPQMQADRTAILSGVSALNSSAIKQLGVEFSAATLAQKVGLFEDACGHEETAAFARRIIELICDGYYTT